jgi:hypothetical protein
MRLAREAAGARPVQPDDATTSTPRLAARWWAAALAAVMVCASLSAQHRDKRQDRSLGPIAVDVWPVPLDPRNPALTTLGEFSFAGGIRLTSRQTDRLHELSDIVVYGENRMAAVGDSGVMFDARLVLDGADRLVGITDAVIAPLVGEDGKPLKKHSRADAEGLARLPSGDRLVSFERRPRIWLYPKDGGVPHAVPSPDTRFPSNHGMEALTAAPDIANDAYMVGGESSGKTWTCRVSTACEKGLTIDKPKGFGLVSLNRLPDGRTACLLRSFDTVRRSRILLEVLDGDKVVAHLTLEDPLTVDNFEGLASTEGRNGGRRFYMISDDNSSPSQRTLIFAFDWRPR